MDPVVWRRRPSLQPGDKKRHDKIAASDQAVYDKLQLVEPEVSQELVRYAHAPAAAVVDSLQEREKPLLPGYRCRIFDGNHLSASQHRIKELRRTWDAPLPGKVLVVLDQETHTAADVFLTPDGHAQERSLLDQVLETVQERDLWISDRNFCTFKFLHGIDHKAAAFVIRQHGQVHGTLQGNRRSGVRTDAGAAFE